MLLPKVGSQSLDCAALLGTAELCTHPSWPHMLGTSVQRGGKAKLDEHSTAREGLRKAREGVLNDADILKEGNG